MINQLPGLKPAVGGGLPGTPQRPAPSQRGEITFGNPGTFFWIVPPGVFSFSVVGISGAGGAFVDVDSIQCLSGGAGGLGWTNNIPCIPGEIWEITVGVGGVQQVDNTGASSAGGLTKMDSPLTVTVLEVSGGASSSSRIGGDVVTGDGGGKGGDGIFQNGSTSAAASGPGCGGYEGDGGDAVGDIDEAAATDGLAGETDSGAAGSGESNIVTSGAVYGGGGVGLFGKGETGAGGGQGGRAGSGGERAQALGAAEAGMAGVYGGGSAAIHMGNSENIAAIGGAPGGLRIVYPGNSRQFPSMDVGQS